MCHGFFFIFSSEWGFNYLFPKSSTVIDCPCTNILWCLIWDRDITVSSSASILNSSPPKIVQFMLASLQIQYCQLIICEKCAFRYWNYTSMLCHSYINIQVLIDLIIWFKYSIKILAAKMSTFFAQMSFAYFISWGQIYTTPNFSILESQ